MIGHLCGFIATDGVDTRRGSLNRRRCIRHSCIKAGCFRELIVRVLKETASWQLMIVFIVIVTCTSHAKHIDRA